MSISSVLRFVLGLVVRAIFNLAGGVPFTGFLIGLANVRLSVCDAYASKGPPADLDATEFAGLH